MTSKLTDNFNELFEQEHIEYDPDNINIESRKICLDQLLQRINPISLDTAPAFPRRAKLWNNGVKSRLIESIIIRIPISYFWIDATGQDEWYIIDGFQRLFAINQFLNNQLRLSNLEYLHTLNGLTLQEIAQGTERRYKRRIQETVVNVNLITKGTFPEVKYNICKRLNTKGLPFSPQELRQALNPGKGNLFLAKLTSLTEFKQVFPLTETQILRMTDRELVLGFLTRLIPQEKLSKPYPSKELELMRTLVVLNHLSESELNHLETSFVKTMQNVLQAFGTQPYQLFQQSTWFDTVSFCLD